MPITINLQDDLPDEVKQIIKDSLNIDSDREFNLAVNRLAKSAFMEYVKMLNEKGLPTRADEVMQERLYFLIKYFYRDRLPQESEISSIFQLTNSQSKTLLKNVRSRYRTKIREQIETSLREIINSAREDEHGDYTMVIASDNLLEELNLLISQNGPTLMRISKIKGSASNYECKLASYDLLNRQFNNG